MGVFGKGFFGKGFFRKLYRNRYLDSIFIILGNAPADYPWLAVWGGSIKVKCVGNLDFFISIKKVIESSTKQIENLIDFLF